MSSSTRPSNASTQPTLDPGVALEVRDVGKCYHIYDKPSDRLKQTLIRWTGKTLHKPFWALEDVSLTINRGDAVGIMGRNGSGKSTLMQIIAGVLSPSTGSVTTRGRIAALLELGSGFNPEFTGRDNAYLYGSILGLPRKAIDERFEAIEAFADIGRFMDQPLKTYSSGMKIRLAFSVQAQVEPDVFIIDEALSVGDNLFQKRCRQRLEELRDKGVTLLFVSHQQEQVRTLCNKAVLLHDGKLRATGEPKDVVLDYRRLLHEEEKRWYTARADNFRKVASKARDAKANLVELKQPEPALAAANNGSTNGSPGATANNAATAAQGFGDLDAEVLAVDIFDELGDPTGDVVTGGQLTIRVTVRAHTELTNLNIALRLRNKEGVKVYSWGTLNQDIATWAGTREIPDGSEGDQPIFWERTFAAGDTVTVDFPFTASLGLGFYEVQAMVAEERDRYYNDQRMLHWLDEAAFFQVRVIKEEYFFGGVADLRMEAHVHQG